uniref:Shisa N-terminal domain-containing protein n=1 Tax=Sinocyclocheilus anshuiensis TaxID=1608454 RepID=A0A671T2U0_9TELE
SCAMASTLAVLLLLSAGLFTVKDCESYYTIYNEYRPGFKCFFQYCCGNCDNRFCCPSEHLKLTASPDGEQIFTVAGAHVTTVTNTHFIQQQPVMQGAQCPQYQPMPTHPGYGQPMQTGPYQGQPYAPGPPPSCQAMYPMQPPAQPGVAYMPSETSNQLAYNPAYVQPPNIGY